MAQKKRDPMHAEYHATVEVVEGSPNDSAILRAASEAQALKAMITEEYFPNDSSAYQNWEGASFIASDMTERVAKHNEQEAILA
ncbi:MAG: hypothetical protein LJE59_14355 [Chromatiaceae bacterium]|nr:hypothetical protein [Chromatiaceae bacterium]